MNIKTITCHHVYNYGATLQAYALQSYLESIGHDVEIIDYRLPEHVRYELFTPYPKGKAYELVKKYPILKFILTPIQNRSMLKTWGRKRAFDRFDSQYLKISEPTYRTYEAIKNNPPTADVFVAGSDQIWNPVMRNGNDPGYYLDFGSKKVKRISYAASFGVKSLSDAQGLFVKKQLTRFDAISVRESSGVNILKELGFGAVRCVDPVFLLDMNKWIKNLGLESKPEDYIMVYDFTHDDNNIKTFAEHLAKAKGLKIIAVNDFENTPYADIQINDADPKVFLQYILNARYIVANSFHATAFSLLFHKHFVTFPLVSQPNPSRMIDLLNSVGLLNHFQPIDQAVIDENIKWDVIDNYLSQDTEQSMKYLHDSIM